MQKEGVYKMNPSQKNIPDASSQITLPDAVIIIMVDPNALNIILEDEIKNNNDHSSKWSSKRQTDNNSNINKIRNIKPIELIVDKYRSDAIRYETKRITEQLLDLLGNSSDDLDIGSLFGNITKKSYNIKYIHDIQTESDYLDEYRRK